MFIKIDKATFINTNQITYFHEESRILKLTSGESFLVDPEKVEYLKRSFSLTNAKESP